MFSIEYLRKGATEAMKYSVCSNSFGRKVGAVILDFGGNVISHGYSFVADDMEVNDGDKRLNKVFDDIVAERLRVFLEYLVSIGVIPTNLFEIILEHSVNNESGRGKQVSSPVLGISETVHAEMYAVIKADRKLLHNSVLFSTLEPCSSCLKYIRFSGVSRIYYIEKNGYESYKGRKVDGINLYEITL